MLLILTHYQSIWNNSHNENIQTNILNLAICFIHEIIYISLESLLDMW